MHIKANKLLYTPPHLDKSVLLLTNFLVTVIIFHPFFAEHYSIDSFEVLYNDFQSLDAQTINGRWFYAGVVYLLDLLGLGLIRDALLWEVLYMFTSAFCCSVLVLYVTRWNKESNFLTLTAIDLGGLIAFNNVFIAEWYQFVEALPMYTITISFSTMAALQIAKVKDDNKAYRWILALLFLMISYNTYQAGVPLFFFLILALTIAQAGDSFELKKSDLLRLGGAIVLCIVTVFSNLIFTKLAFGFMGVTGSRYDGLAIQNIIDNAVLLLKNQRSIWFTADGMMNGPFLFAYLILELALIAVGLTRSTKSVRLISVFLIFFSFAAGLLGTFSTVLITDTFWMAPRSIVPLFALFFLTSLVIARFGRKVQLTHIVFSSIFLFITMIQVGNYATDMVYSNRRDRDQARMIQAEIEQYEETSNQVVTELAFVPDAGMQWRWDVGGKYQWDVCEKAIAVSWEQLSLFRFYTGRIYQSADVPVEIEEYSTAHDWNEYIPDEQLLFDGNKCYICLF